MAKRLLKEAGYGNGFKITLGGPTDRYPQGTKIAEAVVKYLNKIGIEADLDLKPKSIFFPEITKGKFEFSVFGWFDGSYDMNRTYGLLFHTFDTKQGYGSWNGTRFSDPTIDVLVESSISIVDQEKRKRVLQDLNKMAMVDKIACIPLHYGEDLYAFRKGKGIRFEPHPDKWIVFKEIFKD